MQELDFLHGVALPDLENGRGEEDGGGLGDDDPGALPLVRFERHVTREDVPAPPHHQVRIEVVPALDPPDQVFAARPDALDAAAFQQAGPLGEPGFGGLSAGGEGDERVRGQCRRQGVGVTPDFGTFGHENQLSMPGLYPNRPGPLPRLADLGRFGHGRQEGIAAASG